jgi:hypothetical protein
MRRELTMVRSFVYAAIRIRMRLEAHLTTGDLQDALLQLTPMTVSLNPDTPSPQLTIRAPSKVVLLDGLGLQVVTDLQLQWDLIGMRVPVSLRRVSLLLRPVVELFAGQPALLFLPQLQEADLSAIPGILRDVILAPINDALSRPDARMAWHFMDTLDFSFPLPAQVLPAFQVRLFARSASVHVENGVLRLGIDWGLTAEPPQPATP